MDHKRWFRRISGTVFLGSCLVFMAIAQTPTDGIMMRAGQTCIGLDFANESWQQYWEGTFLRENGNLGTVTRQSLAFSVNYGISQRLNVIGRLPWMSVKASEGQLAPSSGLQDWGLWLKAKVWQSGPWSLLGVAGATGPASRYAIDYMPLNLGLGAVEGTVRGLVQYYGEKGFYAWAQSGVHLRSNVRIERNYYYTTRAYYTNLVDLPNAVTWGTALGQWWKSGSLRTELNAEGLRTLGGHDIRRADSPFPSNRMNALRIGGLVQYFHPDFSNFGLLIGLSHTLQGRNLGQATIFSTGLQYRFPANSSPTPTNDDEE